MNSNTPKPDIKLPNTENWIDQVTEKARQNMIQHGSCTQSILAAFLDGFELDSPLVMRAAGAMHGGMLTSLTCGVHTGCMMVLGLLMGREKIEQGHDALMPITLSAQKLIRRLNKNLGGHACLGLSGVDFSDLKQAASFRSSPAYEQCLNRVADGARITAGFLKELDDKGELFRVRAN